MKYVTTWQRVFIAALGILVIAGLCFYALSQGEDGIILGSCIAVIAGIVGTCILGRFIFPTVGGKDYDN